jgi:riboflavin synthase alpha subunit
VSRRRGRRLSFDVGPETVARTTLGALRKGDPVNLEPALTPSTPLGGHLVTGHVDAVAKVLARKGAGRGGFVTMAFSLPAALERLVAPKGSVAVDGVSLTVTAVRQGAFEVMLVPHTLARTTLGRREPGDAVNLEVDLLARYLERQLEARR